MGVARSGRWGVGEWGVGEWEWVSGEWAKKHKSWKYAHAFCC